MASARKPEVETQAEKIEIEEFNLDKKVTVRSIAPWNTGFERRVDGFGDVNISPSGSVRLSRNEIIAQVQMNNVLFVGVDGVGSHATLVIEDAPTRKEVDFENDTKSQLVFTSDVVTNLFVIKKQSDFEKEFENHIVTRAEKFAVMSEIKKRNLNDYQKIRFAEKYTGIKLENIN